MDREIKPRRFASTWMILVGTAGVLLLAGMVVYRQSAPPTLNVAADRLTLAQVRRAEFRNFVSVTGTIQPARTVFLDAFEGGTVEEIFGDEGGTVEQGVPLLRLGNAQLRKDYMTLETNLLEQVNQLRNTRLSLTEQGTALRQEMLKVEYEIKDLTSREARFQQLRKQQMITQEQYEQLRNELQYKEQQRGLLQGRLQDYSRLTEPQLREMDATLRLLNRNLRLVDDGLSRLVIRAPISGQLSELKVDVGQSVQKGDNIGQIDVVDHYKVEIAVDQFYLGQVALDQRGSYSDPSGEYTLKVAKIYPEVAQGLFKADMVFEGTLPGAIRRGQSIQVNLDLGKSKESLLVDKGSFTRDTGGLWIFRVSEDRRRAERVPIRLGRQNPLYYEIAQGLAAGDWVVISTYERFGKAEALEFDTAPPLPAARTAGAD